MRIAIIGTGISGLTAAYKLWRDHDLTLFEANDYIGGHTNTVSVDFEGEQFQIDTGFIVFNDWTYPNFIQLMNELGVESIPTSMGFSVRCDRTGWEYSGNTLQSLFCQRRNLTRPAFLRMILDILRFNRQGKQPVESLPESMTVGEFLQRYRYSAPFREQYLLPMGSAIWSCPNSRFAEFPIRFILEFYQNHGLLNLWNRPTWRVIRGGSHNYVKKMTAPFLDRIRLNSPVERVVRNEDGVQVTVHGLPPERFDHVIFACHSDQSLRMLADPTLAEKEILREFPYERNVAILHTDTNLLPHNRGAWSSWNYHVSRENCERATLTYNMNILQRIDSDQTFLVTLNEDEQIDPQKVLKRIVYHHPVYTVRRAVAQSRHAELINHHRTSYCGAYWGNGFHEDGVKSALAVCNVLQGGKA